MERVAVDPATKTYWEKYFKPVGDFGKQWVDDVPRRVKAEVAHLAGVDAADVLPIPLGHALVAGNKFTVEGSARMLTKTGAVDRLWRAEIDFDAGTVAQMVLA